jgi:uncharacterized membrane protein YccC
LPAAAPSPAAGGRAGLRPAFQTAIATGLAIAAGELVSPSRWYWAAFTAFVMFQGTRSRGESIAKGVQFMVGTLGGVLAGMLAATLLSGHEILTVAAIIVAVFLAFQANVTAYGMMVFWITIILGLLFGMLGYFTPDLLVLRLKEAAVGATCGALVASLVLVRREGAATEEATVAFLRALGKLVDSAARALLDGTPGPDLAGRILAAEQSFRDLSTIAKAGHLGLTSARDEPVRRRLLLLGACESWGRELGQISLQSAKLGDPVLEGAVRRAAEGIDATLLGLVDRSAVKSAAPPISDDAIETLVRGARNEASHRAVVLLLRIQATLGRVSWG